MERSSAAPKDLSPGSADCHDLVDGRPRGEASRVVALEMGVPLVKVDAFGAILVEVAEDLQWRKPAS